MALAFSRRRHLPPQLVLLVLCAWSVVGDVRPPSGCLSTLVSKCDYELHSRCLPKTPDQMPAPVSLAPIRLPDGTMEVPRPDVYLNRTRSKQCDCAQAHRACLVKISPKCLSHSPFCKAHMWRCRTYCTGSGRDLDLACPARSGDSSLQMDRRKREQEAAAGACGHASVRGMRMRMRMWGAYGHSEHHVRSVG